MSEVSIQTNTTPEGEKILGKFDSQDELAKAYQELEKKLGSGFAQTPEERATNETTTVSESNPTEDGGTESKSEEPESPYGEAITSALTTAGLDVNAIATEFESEEGLKPDTRSKLDSLFGKQMVDSYFAGLTALNSDQQAQVQAGMTEVTSAVGGDEAWNTIAQWAAGPNGDQGIAEVYNAALDRGDFATMKLAAIQLKSQYESKNGTLNATSIKEGIASGANSAEGYTSKQEMMKDIGSPEYAHDPAFREQVARRIAKTKGFIG